MYSANFKGVLYKMIFFLNLGYLIKINKERSDLKILIY